jgi:pimeloyl-ACP methyl ester carboxylesterase
MQRRHNAQQVPRINGPKGIIMVASQAIAASHTALVELKSGGARRPLICIHPVDGTLSAYRWLLKQLPDDLPVYGLRADDRIKSDQSLSELATRYCDELMASKIEPPYRLIGFSFGALMAMHVATEVEARGSEIEFVGIIDYRPLHVRNQQAMRESLANYLAAVFQQYGLPSSTLRSLSKSELTKVAVDLAVDLLDGERLPSIEDGVIALQKVGLIDRRKRA